MPDCTRSAPGAEKSRTTVAWDFFAFLEEQGLPYCVVGDCRHLPAQIDSDIDIVVAQATLARVSSYVSRFCSDADLRLVQCLQHESTAFYFVVSWVTDAGPQFLHLDICGDYYRHGRLFMSAVEILSARVRVERGVGRVFFVPTSAHAFVYYLLKRIDKQSLNERHGEYLSSEWRREPRSAGNQIVRFWSGEQAQMVADAAESGVWDLVRARLPELRGSLRRTLADRQPSRLPELARRIRRGLNPTGLFVAVVGPDGSGKTSVINAIRRDLAPAFRRTGYCHLRPRVGLRSGAGRPTPDPHGEPPRGRAASIAKAAYYVLDYAVGYAWSVRPQLVRSTLVVFDRYAYDLAIDPRRCRYRGPSFLARLVGWLVPQPDLVIVLDAPPDVLIQRKQELPAAALRQVREGYQSLASALPHAYSVDAAAPLGEVVTHAERIILDYMVDRTRQRLRPSREMQADANARRRSR